MRSIKLGIATLAVVGATVSSGYAAGVVTKSGHEVDDHAAHGQSVAAAARAAAAARKEAAATSPSAAPSTTTAPTTAEAPSTEPSESPTSPSATPADEPSAGGHHLGWAKHTPAGHAWGRGHGTGEPVKPAQDAPRAAHRAAHRAAEKGTAAHAAAGTRAGRAPQH